MNSDHRGPIEGRVAATSQQRLSLSWLAGDVQRNPAYSAFRWFFTNPFCNYLSVVVGISHLPRTVYYAKGEGWTYVDGLNWGYSIAEGNVQKLRFVSYRGCWLEGMLGWKTSGALGITLRVARARNLAPKP